MGCFSNSKAPTYRCAQGCFIFAKLMPNQTSTRNPVLLWRPASGTNAFSSLIQGSKLFLLCTAKNPFWQLPVINIPWTFQRIPLFLFVSELLLLPPKLLPLPRNSLRFFSTFLPWKEPQTQQVFTRDAQRTVCKDTDLSHVSFLLKVIC